MGDTPKSKKQQYRKDKPWDTEDIDKWTLPDLKPEHHPYPFAEESSFATLFPKYRENYLREIWPEITRTLKTHGIACELNLVEGSMTVKTTRKTWDPYVILKARDLIKLLARSVPLQQALRILEPEMNCEIVKISGIVRNKERYVKRRQRLIGPNGNTLKALELLTGCYVLVQGNTVAIMGSFSGLKQVRRVILDCMQNVHPIYHIKEMMIKRELSKDESLKNENWTRFLPQFKKTGARIKKVRKHEKDMAREEEEEYKQQQSDQKKQRKQKAKKKEYTPFPPPQLPRKIDLEIESGEYFLSKQQKEKHKMERKMEAQKDTVNQRKQERLKAYQPPKEEVAPKRKAVSSEPSMEELKDKIRKRQKRRDAKLNNVGGESSPAFQRKAAEDFIG